MESASGKPFDGLFGNAIINIQSDDSAYGSIGLPTTEISCFMMSVLTQIGEIGIHAGRDVLLRPSLAAMSSLGEPAEIVDVFARVMAGDLADCVAVLYACADEDVSDLAGALEAQEEGKPLRYVPGTLPVEHVVLLAQSLVRHGIVGVAKEQPRPADHEPEYMREFDAREHAALAMAHLGLIEREAWNMTMTGLVAALRAKFPPSAKDSPGSRAPSKEELDASMEWFEKVEAARAAKEGAH